ncbi:cyanophycinase [Leptolyngbya sp. AN02str]|uniref:cyanophycinase n=1 Tax=Leptolyngbya sp. AN02str TaxID=3423363 RepID=UPI003D3208E6
MAIGGHPPMGDRTPQGPLIIIGGAEDKEGNCTVLREFVRLAGGTKARIVVLTAATSMPREAGDDYTRVFERLGVEDVRIIDTEIRDDADKPHFIEDVQQASGIFFTGGDQARIIELIKETTLDKAIRQRHAAGVVVGGTSAGAAMMPDIMIIEGESKASPRVDVVDMGPGMGFLPGIVIDQHFAQRGRLGRLVSALVQQPANLGFGIDEDTAIIVNEDELEVVGSGSVTVVDESGATYNNVEHLLADEHLAVHNVKLHILPHGFRFNLKTRQPTVPQEEKPIPPVVQPV